MLANYIIDENFIKITLLKKGEYENCVFDNCDFSKQDLSECTFIECTFKVCNLSLCQLYTTAFREVTFIGCKLLGLRFDSCSEFGLSFKFDGCQLDNSSFFKTKIKKTAFMNTSLKEVDFTETDLSEAVFDDCDLSRATFDRTVLEKADFRSSYNFSIDPETNRLKKAKFSSMGLSGLLSKYDIIIE